MEKQYYVIRTEHAGIFAGYIKSRNGTEVTLTDARRLWFWAGAASLSQLAMEGTNRPKDCKFTMVVPEIIIFGVLEIIPCSDVAEQSIKGVWVWKK